MTTATNDRLTVTGEAGARSHNPLGSTLPADMGLLLTLNSRMHCRAPMQRVDPEVDGAAVFPMGTGAVPEHVETYRCACGFTIDAPVLSGQALAS